MLPLAPHLDLRGWGWGVLSFLWELEPPSVKLCSNAGPDPRLVPAAAPLPVSAEPFWIRSHNSPARWPVSTSEGPCHLLLPCVFISQLLVSCWQKAAQTRQDDMVALHQRLRSRTRVRWGALARRGKKRTEGQKSRCGCLQWTHTLAASLEPASRLASSALLGINHLRSSQTSQHQTSHTITSTTLISGSYPSSLGSAARGFLTKNDSSLLTAALGS